MTSENQYRVALEKSGFKKNPLAFNNILNIIPFQWVNNFETKDIITIVKILKKYIN